MVTINETKRTLSDVEEYFILNPLQKISEMKKYPIVVLTNYSYSNEKNRWSYKFVSNSTDGRTLEFGTVTL